MTIYQSLKEDFYEERIAILLADAPSIYKTETQAAMAAAKMAEEYAIEVEMEDCERQASIEEEFDFFN
jgi:hypothetical protein